MDVCMKGKVSFSLVALFFCVTKIEEKKYTHPGKVEKGKNKSKKVKK